MVRRRDLVEVRRVGSAIGDRDDPDLEFNEDRAIGDGLSARERLELVLRGVRISRGTNTGEGVRTRFRNAMPFRRSISLFNKVKTD